MSSKGMVNMAGDIDGENIRKEFARFCPEYSKAMMNKDFPEE
jgi:hypothetical protein